MSNRRHFIAGLAGGGLTLAALQAPETEAPPPPFRKLTKAAAHYQDRPKDIRSCATCSFFEPPKGCVVMEGDVSKDGYCDLFALVD